MRPWVTRLLIAIIFAAVVSAFGTPVFHYLVTGKPITRAEDPVWFGAAYGAIFGLVWLMLGRRR